MNEPITLIKIPLEGFIDILMTLYNKGADFIDIIGTPNEIQDTMSVIVRTEYVNPDNNSFGEGEFIPDEQGTIVEKKLTEEDFNNLV